MADKGKIADEKRRLAELDTLLKNMPETKSLILDLQSTFNFKPEVTNRAELELEKSHLEQQLVEDVQKEQRQTVEEIAITAANQKAQLTAKEHEMFEGLMKKDVLDETDVDKVSDIINKHPDAVESKKLFDHTILHATDKALDNIIAEAKKHPESGIGILVTNRENAGKLKIAWDETRDDPEKRKALEAAIPNAKEELKKFDDLPSTKKEEIHKARVDFEKDDEKSLLRMQTKLATETQVNKAKNKTPAIDALAKSPEQHEAEMFNEEAEPKKLKQKVPTSQITIADATDVTPDKNTIPNAKNLKPSNSLSPG